MQPQFIDHLLEPFTVLSQIDGVRGGANNVGTGSLQITRQLKRCLTTILDDHLFGLLQIDDLHHIFKG